MIVKPLKICDVPIVWDMLALKQGPIRVRNHNLTYVGLVL